MNDEVIEALESTAPVRKNRGQMGDPQTPDAADIRLWRDSLMRFLEELDGSISVREVIFALEGWEP